MLSYSLSNEQVKKLKALQLDLELAKKTIEQFSEEKKKFIQRQSMISNIGASTRIENAVLTDVEIDWIDTTIETSGQEFLEQKKMIENKLSKDKQRSIEEVAGYRDAIRIVFDLHPDFYPLKESDIKGMHRELLKYYPKASYYLGNYKAHSNSVIEVNHMTGQKNTIFRTADPGAVTQTTMSDLVSWYNETVRKFSWTLPVVCEFIFRFLAIHPFQDGNGRLSRLLFHLALLNSEEECFSKVISLIALDRSIEQTRSQYYTVLRKCSGGEFKPRPTDYQIGYFLNYMVERMSKSLDHLKHYAQKYDYYIQLTDSTLQVLNAFKEAPEYPLTTNLIQATLNMPRRTVIFCLNNLIEKGFIRQLGKSTGTRYTLCF